jgi:hypothetical protein
LAASLLALALPGAEHASGCAALLVTKGKVAYPHERSIQAAVNKATPCDWVLVAPGVYPGSVVIRRPDLHLLGLDRNRVVIDGRHRKGVNGIEVRASASRPTPRTATRSGGMRRTAGTATT